MKSAIPVNVPTAVRRSSRIKHFISIPVKNQMETILESKVSRDFYLFKFIVNNV